MSILIFIKLFTLYTVIPILCFVIIYIAMRMLLVQQCRDCKYYFETSPGNGRCNIIKKSEMSKYKYDGQKFYINTDTVRFDDGYDCVFFKSKGANDD